MIDGVPPAAYDDEWWWPGLAGAASVLVFHVDPTGHRHALGFVHVPGFVQPGATALHIHAEWHAERLDIELLNLDTADFHVASLRV